MGRRIPKDKWISYRRRGYTATIKGQRFILIRDRETGACTLQRVVVE
jgi:hypothetical protein